MVQYTSRINRCFHPLVMGARIISNLDFAVTASPSKRLAARRAAFVAAAREVFHQKGFAEATLDDVIALSGGSRQTLYALFGGKQGLFEALVTETCESIFGGSRRRKWRRNRSRRC